MKTAGILRMKPSVAMKVFFLSLLFNSIQCYSQSWVELGSGPNALNPNNLFLSIATDRAGNVYAAGYFTNNMGYNYVAKWDGTVWQELGTGASALKANSYISSIVADTIGNLYAAGFFTDSKGFYYVAKWNGISWTELGTDTNALHANTVINSITTDKMGNVYAAGSFADSGGHPYVAKWNGSKWTEVGLDSNALNASGPIRTITSDDLGNIYAAGNFVDTSNKVYVAKWDGMSWSELGTGPGALLESDTAGEILSITTDAGGSIYTAGTFRDANNYYYVAKWNGTNWQELGSGSNMLSTDTANGSNTGINSIAADPLGNIYAAGYFKDANGKPYVAKWNGSFWSELGGNGFSDVFSVTPYIWSIATDNIGDIFAAGNFTDVNGILYVAEYNGLSNPVKTIQETNNVIVYPNPLTNELIVESKGKGLIELVDIRGKTVYRRIINQTKEFINTTGFNSGTYFLLITAAGGAGLYKQIVKL